MAQIAITCQTPQATRTKQRRGRFIFIRSKRLSKRHWTAETKNGQFLSLKLGETQSSKKRKTSPKSLRQSIIETFYHCRCKSLDQYLRRLECFSLIKPLYTRITTNRLVFWRLPCFFAEMGRRLVQLQKQTKKTFVFLYLGFLCFYMTGWNGSVQFLNLVFGQFEGGVSL